MLNTKRAGLGHAFGAMAYEYCRAAGSVASSEVKEVQDLNTDFGQRLAALRSGVDAVSQSIEEFRPLLFRAIATDPKNARRLLSALASASDGARVDEIGALLLVDAIGSHDRLLAWRAPHFVKDMQEDVVEALKRIGAAAVPPMIRAYEGARFPGKFRLMELWEQVGPHAKAAVPLLNAELRTARETAGSDESLVAALVKALKAIQS